MEIKDFQKRSVRTVNTSLSKRDQLANMAMGAAGEAGEVVDLVKKHLYQGHNLDIEKLIEEMGDTIFYLSNLATVIGIDMREVLNYNYEKLLERFPNGFEVDKSVNRE